MKYILFTLILAPSIALADWQEIGKSQQFSAYVDVGTMSKSGNIVRMTTMLDMFNVSEIDGSKKYKSIISSEDFDCKDKKIKTTSSKYFSDNKGAGIEVHDSVSTNWFKVSAQTIDFLSWRIACGLMIKKSMTN
uniref:surface-adhesin E family protein n=1 Tax=Polynucleobacter sp. TaxID=2029855 RepID=UPI004047CC64